VLRKERKHGKSFQPLAAVTKKQQTNPRSRRRSLTPPHTHPGSHSGVGLLQQHLNSHMPPAHTTQQQQQQQNGLRSRYKMLSFNSIPLQPSIAAAGADLLKVARQRAPEWEQAAAAASSNWKAKLARSRQKLEAAAADGSLLCWMQAEQQQQWEVVWEEEEEVGQEEWEQGQQEGEERLLDDQWGINGEREEGGLMQQWEQQDEEGEEEGGDEQQQGDQGDLDGEWEDGAGWDAEHRAPVIDLTGESD
jgi:hypothetical protein